MVILTKFSRGKKLIWIQFYKLYPLSGNPVFEIISDKNLGMTDTRSSRRLNSEEKRAAIHNDLQHLVNWQTILNKIYFNIAECKANWKAVSEKNLGVIVDKCHKMTFQLDGMER